MPIRRSGRFQLEPAGGRIVGEVLLGLIDCHPTSFRSVDPTWRLALPAANFGSFTVGELLLFADQTA